MSLVEMMVALLVLGVVLSALASVLITSLWSVRGQEATTQATAAINDILEEAQRVEYDVAVLCDTKANTAFGGDWPSGTFEGEDLVLSPDICDTPGEIEPERTVTRDGRDYVVTTAITWTDDPGDGLDASDTDTTQDIKRITVDVAWTVDGETRTARNMAFRAPQLREQMLTAEVLPANGKFVQIADASGVEGANAEAFALRAIAREKMTSVEVKWVDRTGTLQSETMVPVDSVRRLEWRHDVGVNFGPFANGGTLFRFEGTTAAGESGNVTVRGLFLYALSDSGIQRTFPGKLNIGPDGAVCPDQALYIDVEGAIRSDVVQAQWTKLSSVPHDSMVSVDPPPEVELNGARFWLELGGRTDFATYDSTNGEYVPVVNGVNQVKIVVERIVNGDILEVGTPDNLQMQMVPAC